MRKTQAQQLATTLMQQYGLANWKLKWTQAKFWFGWCDYRNKTISLSEPLTELNSMEQVQDTILHEISHALTPNAHHGPEWKDMAATIGCRPKRCYSTEVVVPRGIYTATCRHCRRQIQKNRKPRYGAACGQCCRKYNHGRYAKKYKLIFRRNQKGGEDNGLQQNTE